MTDLSLADELRTEGGLLAGALRDDAASVPAPEALAFGGERVAAAEAIHEAHLVHAEGRAGWPAARVLGGPDEDLLLLGGDRLYALGLDRLAQAGDLDAVAVLAGVIAECAAASATGDAARARQAWADGAQRLAR